MPETRAVTMESLIAAWGLPALTFGTLFEGDAVAFVGGLMAHRGLITPVGAWGAVTLGGVAVDNALFHLGRRSGQSAWMARMLAKPLALRLLGAVAAHPVKIILGFRFVWGTRTVTPPVLAAAGISPLLFAALDAVSVAVWAALYVALGYGLGLTVERLWGGLSWGEHWALSLAAGSMLAAGLFVLWRRRSR
ncbi:DedA family protein [Paragemmobacter straminiformis]|uniref:DedA family protein n=1 Tax=Paragemmobacter straminiformis TaxID=2045119 RepID=A0A842ICL0_9RHOB|nr:DedA family protein [Gemmobacter straminiformis]MBC2837286.1 DedA family protein [Gemmobacter straminiformis]